MTSRQSILYILLALALIRGLIYASVVPPWQAPDEPAQFERARASLSHAEWNSTAANGPSWYDDLSRSLFIYDHWDFLPTKRQTTFIPGSLNRYVTLYHAAYSGLYSSRSLYAVIGWPLFLARFQDISFQLYLVRLNIILMNVGIIFLAFHLTKTIFPQDNFLVLGVPILVLFIPQHTHLLSTVNNGNLAELLALTALYFVIRGIMKGFRVIDLVAISLFSLLAMWTKATAYFLPVVMVTVALFYLWQYRHHWRWLIPIALILLGLAYILSPDRVTALYIQGLTHLKSNQFYLDPIVPIIQFRSFWALPGWLTLNLHPFWYQLLIRASILAVVSLILWGIIHWKLILSKQYRPQILALSVLAVAILASLSIILGWSALLKTIVYRQGRSLYPVLVPIAIFLMLGWRQLIPVAWREVGLLALTSTFFVFDSMVLFHYIVPFFYSRY